MNTLKFTWAFASFLLIIVILFPIATCHLPQCSFEGINFEKCIDQGNNPTSFDSCCNELNQVIQQGYYCLCAILGSSSPLITTSLVFPLSNCFISIPPLIQCQASQAKVSPIEEMKPPPSRPIPIYLPPKEPPQSPSPSPSPLPFPSNMDEIPVMNSTRHDDHNVTIQSPEVLKIPYNDGHLTSFSGDNKRILLYGRVIILIVPTFYVMFMS